MTRSLVLPFLLFLESHCAKNIAKSGEGKKCNLLTKKLGQNALNRPRIFFDISHRPRMLRPSVGRVRGEERGLRGAPRHLYRAGQKSVP